MTDPAFNPYLSRSPLNDYRIVILPPENIIRHIRKVCNDTVSVAHIHLSANNVPQMIFSGFRQVGSMEEKISERLRLICLSQPHLNVQFQGYGHFGEHSIFIGVAADPHINRFVHLLRSELKKLMYSGKDYPAYFMSSPHITLFQKLSDRDFNLLWRVLSHRRFNTRFTARYVMLLRRTPLEPRFRIIGQYELENLPIESEQTSMF